VEIVVIFNPHGLHIMSKRHKHSESGASTEPPERGQVQQSDANAIPNPDGVTESGQKAGLTPAAASEIELLAKELDDKEKELAELKDKYLRSLADSENARKRIRQQGEETVRLQREALFHDLLPIADNLERAVEAVREGANALTIGQGVEMVLRSLLDFLRANGVTPVASVGQMFDPARHEAVDHVASDAHPPNTVVDEFHRGYLIGERILRPARVSVAKEPGSAEEGRNDGENGASDKVENS
jgi:molecular chaperone GrpE